MSTHKIILVNRAVSMSVGSVVVSGHSRKPYGNSSWNEKHRAHAIEMTPEQYAKAADDLARNWHKARCKWVPFFETVEGDAEAAKVITPELNEDLRELYLKSARMLGSADLRNILAERGFGVVQQQEESDVVSSTPPASPIASQPYSVFSDALPKSYWPLHKIAKNEGCDVTGLKGIAALQNAILANRQRKAA